MHHEILSLTPCQRKGKTLFRASAFTLTLRNHARNLSCYVGTYRKAIQMYMSHSNPPYIISILYTDKHDTRTVHSLMHLSNVLRLFGWAELRWFGCVNNKCGRKMGKLQSFAHYTINEVVLRSLSLWLRIYAFNVNITRESHIFGSSPLAKHFKSHPCASMYTALTTPSSSPSACHRILFNFCCRGGVMAD